MWNFSNLASLVGLFRFKLDVLKSVLYMGANVCVLFQQTKSRNRVRWGMLKTQFFKFISGSMLLKKPNSCTGNSGTMDFDYGLCMQSQTLSEFSSTCSVNQISIFIGLPLTLRNLKVCIVICAGYYVWTFIGCWILIHFVGGFIVPWPYCSVYISRYRMEEFFCVQCATVDGHVEWTCLISYVVKTDQHRFFFPLRHRFYV
jgi:hypothetical protein